METNIVIDLVDAGGSTPLPPPIYMKHVEVPCAHCAVIINKPLKEFNRRSRLGFTKFYCSMECQTKNRPAPMSIEVVCRHCSKIIKGLTGKRRKNKFCSPSCASAGSVTEYRLTKAKESGHTNKENLISTEITLKLREGPRYKLICEFMDKIKEPYEYEFNIEGIVCDFVLTNLKIVFEFDGPYHNKESAAKCDFSRDLRLRNLGYTVYRIKHGPQYLLPLDPVVDIYKSVKGGT